MSSSIERAREIRQEAIDINRWCRSHGWDTNLGQVIKHHKWFHRWWNKQLAFGYLVHRIGIKRLPGWPDRFE